MLLPAAHQRLLLLLLAQTTMIATGRNELHKQVGIAAFVLVPVLVVVGIVLAPTMYYQTWGALQGATGAMRDKLTQILSIQEDILLLQEIRDLLANRLTPAIVNDAGTGPATGPAGTGIGTLGSSPVSDLPPSIPPGPAAPPKPL